MKEKLSMATKATVMTLIMASMALSTPAMAEPETIIDVRGPGDPALVQRDLTGFTEVSVVLGSCMSDWREFCSRCVGEMCLGVCGGCQIRYCKCEIEEGMISGGSCKCTTACAGCPSNSLTLINKLSFFALATPTGGTT